MAQVRHRLSAAAQLYVFVVVVVGLIVLALSVVELARHPGEWQFKWLPLAGLTLFSGALSVKLPSERATISISETFVLAGTVLLGSGVDAVLVALDALVLCLKESLFGRGLRREQIAFNIVTPATSLWFSALIAGLVPPTSSGTLSLVFVARLAVFTALYFLLNSWLVTFAIALEQREAPTRIWWANFRRLWINFAAGASIAAFA